MRGKHETDCEHWASQLRFVPSVGLNGWGYAQCDGWRCLVEILVQMSFEPNGICNKNIYIPKNCRDGFSGASLEGLCQFFCGRRQLHVGNKWTVKTYNSPVTQIVSGLRNFLKAILGSLRLVDREYMTVYMIFTYLIFNM